MIGHSVGEYSALCVAESVGIEECLKLVKRRGELMEEFTGEASGMLTIRYSTDFVMQVMIIRIKLIHVFRI
jgi:malonyl CoA-acyl carrier protein transacylase